MNGTGLVAAGADDLSVVAHDATLTGSAPSTRWVRSRPSQSPMR